MSTAGTIKFRCEGCSKAFATPADLAGKKVTCKACGHSMRIPAASASSPRPGPKPASAAPPGVDPYGFDDAPAAAKGAGAVADSGLEDVPLPPRPGSTGPLSEAKKKQIAKRAAKIEKTKTSYAGAGLASLGTIIAITLFGWRMVRNVNKIQRAATAIHRGAASDDYGPMPIADPKAAAAEMDREVARMVREPGAAEAREWLDAAKHPDHGVMEMGGDQARAMVAGFYDRGAAAVTVLDPVNLGQSVLTASFAVQLPDDPAQRAQCLQWETQYLQGEEPSKDFGQRYLMITTD